MLHADAAFTLGKESQKSYDKISHLFSDRDREIRTEKALA